MAKYTIFLLLLLAFSTNAQQNIEEELVIFVQAAQQSEFTKNNLKTLEALLKEQGIPVQQLDVSTLGAPPEVSFTPFLVYRNHLGRKVYKGRHTTHQRLLNFIRTVRHLPEAAINYDEKEVFVKEYPRAALLLKPKITSPTGAITGVDLEAAAQKALLGLKKGLTDYAYHKSYGVSDGEELFYMNFYPYLAKDGKVYVSSELYAHYDCHTPIYQQYQQPAVGNSIEEAFAKAGQQMLAEVTRQLEHSENGDAMNFLSKNTPLTPWDKLPLATIKAPQRSTTASSIAVTLPKNWALQGTITQDAPLLTFNFPAPLRHYGGELKQVAGSIQLPNNQSLAAAKGSFIVDVHSLQMGEADLDNYVKSTVLMVNQHPKATLTFKKIVGDDLNLQLGRLTVAQVEAQLELLGKSSTVLANTSFEPIISADGVLLLQVQTQFTAQDLLGNYDIEGPDGPAEANNQLLFQANFLMQSAGEMD